MAIGLKSSSGSDTEYGFALNSSSFSSAGVSGIPHQRPGHPGLCVVRQQTEDLSGCSEGGVWTNCGTAL